MAAFGSICPLPETCFDRYRHFEEITAGAVGNAGFLGTRIMFRAGVAFQRYGTYLCVVKITAKVWWSAVLIAFCCLATRTHLAVASVAPSSGSLETTISFSKITKAPLWHVSPLGSSVKNLGSGSSSTVKTGFNSLWAVVRVFAQHSASAFAQYACMERTFLIRCRKADIIFPFHYFW